MKKCNKCKKEKDLSEFHKDSSHKDGYKTLCKTCKKDYTKDYNLINKEIKLIKAKDYYKNNKDKKLIYQLNNKEKINKVKGIYRIKNLEKHNLWSYKSQIKRKYGITIDQRNKMLVEQNNECAICNNKFIKTPNIDHCHTTNQVRGLLCGNCNRVLGLVKENINILNNTINYIKKYKQ